MKTKKFFYTEQVYEYDIEACYYNLMKSIGLNISNINFENKEVRNREIGILQRENPSLSIVLDNASKNIVNYYIMRNNLDDDSILLIQKDGFLTNKKLEYIDDIHPIRIKTYYSKTIFSLHDKSYLGIKTLGGVDVKGIINKPDSLDFYNKFETLNYNSISSLINSINEYRKFILSTTKLEFFLFKTDEDDIYKTKLINGDIIKLKRNSFKLLNHKDVDKEYLWENYIWKFIEPIVLSINI